MPEPPAAICPGCWRSRVDWGQASDPYCTPLWSRSALTFALILCEMLASCTVSVWPRHLELSRFAPEHRGHGEDGRCGLHGGDGVGRALSERGHGDRLNAQAGGGVFDAARRLDLLGFSQLRMIASKFRSLSTSKATVLGLIYFKRNRGDTDSQPQSSSADSESNLLCVTAGGGLSTSSTKDASARRSGKTARH